MEHIFILFSSQPKSNMKRKDRWYKILSELSCWNCISFGRENRIFHWNQLYHVHFWEHITWTRRSTNVEQSGISFILPWLFSVQILLFLPSVPSTSNCWSQEISLEFATSPCSGKSTYLAALSTIFCLIVLTGGNKTFIPKDKN